MVTQAVSINGCRCMDSSAMMVRKADSQQCTTCSEGEYTANKLSPTEASCEDCPAGRYQEGSQHVNQICDSCPVGRYEANGGRSECTVCGAGMTTRPRFTEDGCECEKSWLISGGGELEKVDSYCGNPDNSLRDWCFKLDASCGDNTWAYCAKGVYCAFESLLCVLPNRNTTCRGFTHRGLGRHGFLGCWVPS